MMGGMQRLAVADLGSNSFRLVVYGYERGRWWQHADEIREPVRVSERLGEDGTLQPEPMERAIRTAELFDAFCKANEIEDVQAVATSAIRDAPNGRELVNEVEARTSLPVRVASTHEEARYGYLAIANSTTVADGFGVDIGGGSVQVTQLSDRQLVADDSWPLGAVRMSERFLPEDDKASGKSIKALRKHVVDEVARAAAWFHTRNGDRLAGIGGTIRNLATAAERRAGVHHPGSAQGFRLTVEALDDLIDELAGMPASKRGRVPGIKPDRGDVILGGAVALSALMESSGFEQVEVTEAGMREGVFFESFLGDRDPPLFPDVRRASIENLANRYQPDLHHPRHVAELSLQLYDGLAAAGLLEAEEADRELLWSACLVHDVGTAVDYDDHHKHSRYLIENAGLPGFTPREVLLIALIAQYHRKGTPDAGELGKLAEKGDERRLSTLSGIVRLSEQFERSRDGAVRSIELEARDGTVVVEPDLIHDASVAIWSARGNADLLEKAIGREVEIAGP
jgi:exopolyphosphatase / guanosine-5'-triphosphate,3'-diphosphate pyrophosphatase